MEKRKKHDCKSVPEKEIQPFPGALFLHKGKRWCRIIAQTVEKRERRDGGFQQYKECACRCNEKLMVCKSFAKISISDLCEECGLNRKSFYYHFKDKYDLVNWIFYVDFLTNMGGKNFENEWDVLVAVCNIFYQNKAFYQSALRIEGQNSLRITFTRCSSRSWRFCTGSLSGTESETVCNVLL